jgi:hypothetical protein
MIALEMVHPLLIAIYCRGMMVGVMDESNRMQLNC